MVAEEVTQMADDDEAGEPVPAKPVNISRAGLRERLPVTDEARPADLVRSPSFDGRVQDSPIPNTALLAYLIPTQGLMPFALAVLREHMALAAVSGEHPYAVQAYDIYRDFQRELGKHAVPIRDKDGALLNNVRLPDGLWRRLAERYNLSESTIRRRVAFAEEIMAAQVQPLLTATLS